MKFYQREELDVFGVFRFTENMTFMLLLRAGFVVLSGSFQSPFFCSRGLSLVQLTGDDSNNATSIVAVIRMSLKEYAMAITYI